MSISLRGRLLAAVFSVSVGFGAAAPAGAETLADAIALAYETNPTLQAARASQRALDENYVQARSGWRPTLSLGAGWAYSENATPDVVARALGAVDRNGDGVIDGRGRVDTANSRATLNLTQPLWTGGRVAASVSAAHAEVLAGHENLRRIEAQVLTNVIQFYVDVRRDQEAVRIREANVQVLGRQVEETQARFDVGEITRTDVAQSQSRLAAARSLLQSTQSQLAISRAAYATVVGQNPGELAPEPSLAHLLPSDPDQAFDLAEKFNPQLRAQKFTEIASRARLAGARADRMPNVTAQATLDFRNQVREEVWEREFYTRGSSLGVNVTVPLFNGGLTSSRIRAAADRNTADRIGIEGVRRSVMQGVTQFWSSLLAARSNIASSDEQVRAATIAATGTREEQQVGLRTTIDVLNAEQELRAAELSQVSARRDEYVAATNVLALMGRLEGRNLVPAIPQYDAARHFRNLRITWGWVPWEEPIAIIDHVLTPFPAPNPGEMPGESPIPPGLTPPPAR